MRELSSPNPSLRILVDEDLGEYGIVPCDYALADLSGDVLCDIFFEPVEGATAEERVTPEALLVVLMDRLQCKNCPGEVIIHIARAIDALLSHHD